MATAEPISGGSADGYQGFSAPSAILTTAEQADGQAVCLCVVGARTSAHSRDGRGSASGIVE